MEFTAVPLVRNSSSTSSFRRAPPSVSTPLSIRPPRLGSSSNINAANKAPQVAKDPTVTAAPNAEVPPVQASPKQQLKSLQRSPKTVTGASSSQNTQLLGPSLSSPPPQATAKTTSSAAHALTRLQRPVEQIDRDAIDDRSDTSVTKSNLSSTEDDPFEPCLSMTRPRPTAAQSNTADQVMPSSPPNSTSKVLFSVTPVSLPPKVPPPSSAPRNAKHPSVDTTPPAIQRMKVAAARADEAKTSSSSSDSSDNDNQNSDAPSQPLQPVPVTASGTSDSGMSNFRRGPAVTTKAPSSSSSSSSPLISSVVAPPPKLSGGSITNDHHGYKRAADQQMIMAMDDDHECSDTSSDDSSQFRSPMMASDEEREAPPAFNRTVPEPTPLSNVLEDDSSRQRMVQLDRPPPPVPSLQVPQETPQAMSFIATTAEPQPADRVAQPSKPEHVHTPSGARGRMTSNKVDAQQPASLKLTLERGDTNLFSTEPQPSSPSPSSAPPKIAQQPSVAAAVVVLSAANPNDESIEFVENDPNTDTLEIVSNVSEDDTTTSHLSRRNTNPADRRNTGVTAGTTRSATTVSYEVVDDDEEEDTTSTSWYAAREARGKADYCVDAATTTTCSNVACENRDDQRTSDTITIDDESLVSPNKDKQRNAGVEQAQSSTSVHVSIQPSSSATAVRRRSAAEPHFAASVPHAQSSSTAADLVHSLEEGSAPVSPPYTSVQPSEYPPLATLTAVAATRSASVATNTDSDCQPQLHFYAPPSAAAMIDSATETVPMDELGSKSYPPLSRCSSEDQIHGAVGTSWWAASGGGGGGGGSQSRSASAGPVGNINNGSFHLPPQEPLLVREPIQNIINESFGSANGVIMPRLDNAADARQDDTLQPKSKSSGSSSVGSSRAGSSDQRFGTPVENGVAGDDGTSLHKSNADLVSATTADTQTPTPSVVVAYADNKQSKKTQLEFDGLDASMRSEDPSPFSRLSSTQQDASSPTASKLASPAGLVVPSSTFLENEGNLELPDKETAAATSPKSATLISVGRGKGPMSPVKQRSSLAPLSATPNDQSQSMDTAVEGECGGDVKPSSPRFVVDSSQSAKPSSIISKLTGWIRQKRNPEEASSPKSSTVGEVGAAGTLSTFSGVVGEGGGTTIDNAKAFSSLDETQQQQPTGGPHRDYSPPSDDNNQTPHSNPANTDDQGGGGGGGVSADDVDALERHFQAMECSEGGFMGASPTTGNKITSSSSSAFAISFPGWLLGNSALPIVTPPARQTGAASNDRDDDDTPEHDEDDFTLSSHYTTATIDLTLAPKLSGATLVNETWASPTRNILRHDEDEDAFFTIPSSAHPRSAHATVTIPSATPIVVTQNPLTTMLLDGISSSSGTVLSPTTQVFRDDEELPPLKVVVTGRTPTTTTAADAAASAGDGTTTQQQQQQQQQSVVLADDTLQHGGVLFLSAAAAAAVGGDASPRDTSPLPLSVVDPIPVYPNIYQDIVFVDEQSVNHSWQSELRHDDVSLSSRKRFSQQKSGDYLLPLIVAGGVRPHQQQHQALVETSAPCGVQGTDMMQHPQGQVIAPKVTAPPISSRALDDSTPHYSMPKTPIIVAPQSSPPPTTTTTGSKDEQKRPAVIIAPDLTPKRPPLGRPMAATTSTTFTPTTQLATAPPPTAQDVRPQLPHSDTNNDDAILFKVPMALTDTSSSTSPKLHRQRIAHPFHPVGDDDPKSEDAASEEVGSNSNSNSSAVVPTARTGSSEASPPIRIPVADGGDTASQQTIALHSYISDTLTTKPLLFSTSSPQFLRENFNVEKNKRRDANAGDSALISPLEVSVEHSSNVMMTGLTDVELNGVPSYDALSSKRRELRLKSIQAALQAIERTRPKVESEKKIVMMSPAAFPSSSSAAAAAELAAKQQQQQQQQEPSATAPFVQDVRKVIAGLRSSIEMYSGTTTTRKSSAAVTPPAVASFVSSSTFLTSPIATPEKVTPHAFTVSN